MDVKMSKSSGDIDGAIWLLGDSNPKNWESELQEPLDARHPARHNIWTPVLLEIQDRVFGEGSLHLDQAKFYVRNAIEDPSKKPTGTVAEWPDEILNMVKSFGKDMEVHRPQVIFTFGAFAFEFAQRAIKRGTPRPYVKWGATELGTAFRASLGSFSPAKTNTIPLLHVSIARGRFIQAHDKFCNMPGENYFAYVGKSLADKFLEHRAQLKIWTDSQ